MVKNQAGQESLSSKDIIYYLLDRKKWIIAPTILVSLIILVFVLWLPNVYRSEVLLLPNNQGSQSLANGLGSQLGGLASLTGINLSGGGNEELNVALEVMKSRLFITNFIEKYELEALLFASTGWDSSSNTIIYDRKIFDKEHNSWVDGAERPTRQEMYKSFLIDNFGYSSNKEAGTYIISIRHYSPQVAKQILEKFVLELNLLMKKKAIESANLKLSYLSKAIQGESRGEMLEVLHQLTSQHVKRKMLAEIRADYIFTIIDPAVVAEKKFAPKRGAICILAFLVSLILFSFIQIVNYYIRLEK